MAQNFFEHKTQQTKGTLFFSATLQKIVNTGRQKFYEPKVPKILRFPRFRQITWHVQGQPRSTWNLKPLHFQLKP